MAISLLGLVMVPTHYEVCVRVCIQVFVVWWWAVQVAGTTQGLLHTVYEACVLCGRVGKV